MSSDISTRSLILQGLVLTSSLAVAGAAQTIINRFASSENKGVIGSVVYATVAVGGTILAANTILREPTEKALRTSK